MGEDAGSCRCGRGQGVIAICRQCPEHNAPPFAPSRPALRLAPPCTRCLSRLQDQPSALIQVQVQAESYLGTSVSDANMTVTWSTALASGLLVRGDDPASPC